MISLLDAPVTIEPYDPEQTYEQFLEKRGAGIGSSDVADVLGVGDYACRRRLLLDRLGLLDHKDSHHLDRGKFFEGPVADLYAARTGRKLVRVGTGSLGEYHFLRANADRLVYGIHSGSADGSRHGTESQNAGENKPRPGFGILEIKCPAAGTFRKVKREGLLDSWIVQIQYQMLCYGARWASVAVFWADGFELEWFDIERDEKLCAHLFEAAQVAWSEIDHIRNTPLTQVREFLPAALDEHSKACANCPAREYCHGGKVSADRSEEAEFQHLEPLVAEYQELKAEEKSLEARKSEVSDALKSAFPEKVGKIRAGKFLVSLTECQREGFDAAQAKKDLPESVVAKYIKITKYDRMTVKQNG